MSYALEIKNLKKTYENGFEALRGVNLSVEKGDFFALLGPNGAGKSTTIGILCSLVNKSSGSVKVMGYNIDAEFAMAKRFLGVVPQEFNFNQFEKAQNILINTAGYHGIPRLEALPRIEHYLKRLGLWDKRDDPSRELSGGMKRRLLIARALVHQPDLLILDEPTAGVDIELRRGMWDFLTEINRQGTTIILTTHYLEEAEALCRNVSIINHGEIIANSSTRDLLATLNAVTFVCDLEEPVSEAPSIEGFECILSDPSTLEVEVDRGQSLNEVFLALSNHSVSVTSMRTKTNRLEELFVSMTSEGSV
ncbi:MAG TPA: ABC transporter [Gammaproteobacteria bacterium]|nr:ABC transporter [Gammaproteobacteria bacterium]